jgi:hypothetical protein
MGFDGSRPLPGLLGKVALEAARMSSAIGIKRPKNAFGGITWRTFRDPENWNPFSSFLEEDDVIDCNKHLSESLQPY